MNPKVYRTGFLTGATLAVVGTLAAPTYTTTRIQDIRNNSPAPVKRTYTLEEELKTLVHNAGVNQPQQAIEKYLSDEKFAQAYNNIRQEYQQLCSQENVRLGRQQIQEQKDTTDLHGLFLLSGTAVVSLGIMLYCMSKMKP